MIYEWSLSAVYNLDDDFADQRGMQPQGQSKALPAILQGNPVEVLTAVIMMMNHKLKNLNF